MIAAMLPVTAFAEDTGVAINVANFPDANFRKVVSKFDTNSDGVLSDTEIGNVTVIDCSYTRNGFSSLKGIEFFVVLMTLDCEYNKLTVLDVSKNTALTELNCRYNELTSLDVSKSVALTELNCNSNPLTELDVSKNAALKKLDCIQL